MEAEVMVLGRAADRPSDDGAAVADLYQGHALGLMRLALMMVGDKPTAEDVVQEAFLGLYRRWAHLRDRERALTYVRSAVLNGCRNALRRRRLPFLAEHVPPIWSAESQAMVSEERREVLRALHRLPTRQREALVLRYFCELSEEQIAEAMQISRGTVKSTTSRAVTALARILKEEQ